MRKGMKLASILISTLTLLLCFLLIQNVSIGSNTKHENESSKNTNTKSEQEIKPISDEEGRHLIKEANGMDTSAPDSGSGNLGGLSLIGTYLNYGKCYQNPGGKYYVYPDVDNPSKVLIKSQQMMEFGSPVLTYKLNRYGNNPKNSYTIESTKKLKQIDLKEGRELVHKATGRETTSDPSKGGGTSGLIDKGAYLYYGQVYEDSGHEYYVYPDPKKADKVIVKEEFVLGNDKLPIKTYVINRY